MPKAELEAAPVDDDLDLESEADIDLEDDTDDPDDQPTAATDKRKGKPRLTLADENNYVFVVQNKDVDGTRKTAKKNISSLKYTNGTEVEGFRVWDIIKDAVYDKESGKLTSGEVIACVDARTNDQASRLFLESKGYDISLTYKMRKTGRARTKIDSVYLMYGQLMQKNLFVDGIIAKGFKPNADTVQLEAWNKLFGVGGQCHHYLNEDGSWKEAS